LCIGLVFSALAVLWATLPKGSFLHSGLFCAVQVLLPVFACWRSRREEWFKVFAFPVLTLAAADLIYFYVVYVKHLSRNPAVDLFLLLIYPIGYLGIVRGILRSFQEPARWVDVWRSRRVRWFSLAFVALIGATMGPQVYRNLIEHSLSWPELAARTIALGSAWQMATLAFFALLGSRGIIQSLFLAGAFWIGICEWTVQTEGLSPTKWEVTLNGLFWSYGVILLSLPGLAGWKKISLRPYEGRSLIAGLRFQVICSVVGIVAILGAFFASTPEHVALFSMCIAVICVLVVIANTFKNTI
jgi:hypothetical protein